ncbi:DUF4179 domain-containing protein [Paenibacillus piri]|uniref:DUF4179 domain-containing protein n=1 Tax=Paenibacillus piri TaxID=2547395 RepID=A0A4V2ZT02_9BACL|nr:DUF4179 domain-containing protein [Paenibacillus piri]TDF95134.1 DUF4179 domain-containing protein [Paenibacillus piri]
MNKAEQTFAKLLNEEKQMDYPDFDAMWKRLESQLPGPDEKLLPVDMNAPKRSRLRKAAVISVLSAVLAATPVVAAISYNWDHILSYRSGIQSALQQGLGQIIEKSVTHDGAKLTVHTAIVDDNRTVLLYSLTTQEGTSDSLYFSGMELKDNQGRVIEGRHSQSWDQASKSWTGYFETEWTPDGVEADVQLTARKLQSFASMERDIDFHPLDGKSQSFDIGQDGIGKLTLQPFAQGDNMMFASAITFNLPEAQQWSHPRIGVFKGNAAVKEAGPGVFGKPGEHGEYTGQQRFALSYLQEPSVTYKLLYTREVRHIDSSWTYDLHLDKKQMLSGTVKRSLNIPVEHPDGRMVLNQMIVTPTQIRIKASHEKYMRFPYLNYALEVNGTVLNGGIWHNGDNPEETTFRFEVPPGLRVTEQMPVTFVAKYEVLQHKDAKDSIRLKKISERKQTMTTQVGAYTVQWTYYKQDGNLYVQSECTDPSFGGVNQTYMVDGEKTVVGKPVSANFSGDGNNKAIDMYENFNGTDADIHIFWYYTEDPAKELRVAVKE